MMKGMDKYKKLSETKLLEMLAEYTTKYTAYLQINSDSKGQQEYKMVIDDLVAEMCHRKSQTFSKAKVS